MTPFDDTLALIARDVAPVGNEDVALSEAAGRVLAQPLYARNDAPRRAVAAMDGYAVIDAATRPGVALRIVGESRAGARYPYAIKPGEAVRIFTGAPMPPGADRCIIQEHAQRDGDNVQFTSGYGPGWHVRAAASDFSAGVLLLEAGTRLSPRMIISAAAADVAPLTVAKRPRIAIIGTGDELAPPGSAYLNDDAIPDSVSYGVAALAAEGGGIITSRATGSDNLPALEQLASEALAAADLVIVTGGASVGDHDLARPMFAAHGLQLSFSKLPIKPGKPVWLGRARDNDGQSKWVLGLPGNPTSAMVTARLFLLPLLARLQGQSVDAVMQWRSLALASALPAIGKRETFIRARWDEAGLTATGNQDSGLQTALAKADWLIRCAPGQASLPAGTMVTALSF